MSTFYYASGQDHQHVNPVNQHVISSEYLKEDRTYWVSLPLHYSDSINYPVIYVFDAEWRFDLVRHMVFDLGANGKIQKSIVVGIPHVDWENKRGIDLTFSESRIEYDGEAVDSTWYNKTNSGGASRFYKYLTEELFIDVASNYSVNDHQTLIGHSYGGYFGAYILSLDHPFEVIHMYDPSIWYSNGEVIERFRKANYMKETRVFLSYQPIPEFHSNKIRELIDAMGSAGSIQLTTKYYPKETHNSLFLDSFYTGILATNH